MIIDDAKLRPEANNLTLVRLVLASAVILSHSYERARGVAHVDQLSGILVAPVSAYAVDGFFFLSGFLVYPSLARRGVAQFVVARLARLWPALAVAVFAAVAVGLVITQAGPAAYWEGATARFIFKNLLLIGGDYTLTGVRCGEALCNVNGSLWTLPWEARCYAVLALCGLVGLAKRGPMLALVLPGTLLFAALWHLPAVQALARAAGGEGAVYLIGQFDRLWFVFALGIAASLFRQRLRLSWWVLAALFAANLVAHRLDLGLHVRGLFISYAVLCMGFLTARDRSVSGRWPDYSYGIYIYAWPVMMLIAAPWPAPDPLALAALNLLAILPLAAFSWHWVEKPVLELVRRRGARPATAAPGASGLPAR